jgi:hypothetical protein
MDAPLGWDNTTELLAETVDTLNLLARMFYNANSERPNSDELPRVQRPYDKTTAALPVTSVDEIQSFLKE